MFTDARSKKILFVAHCILNQNAKIDRCAHYPGAMCELSQALLDAGVGIIQMPCPELLHLGLDRQSEKDKETTIESEDNRVSSLMKNSIPRQLCGAIATDIIYQIKQYQQNGFKVVGLLGINASPTCGVETGWANGMEINESGVLIKAIKEECIRHGINIPFRGVKAKYPMKALEIIKEMLVQQIQ